jgi:hypothetical protein
LQDAASIAGLLITTEPMLAEKPKSRSPSMPSVVALLAEFSPRRSRRRHNQELIFR